MAKTKGFTLWFTGMSGSGKTTLADKCQEILLERGLNVEVLDGDIIRTNLSVDEALKMVVSAGRMSPQEVSDKLFVRPDEGGTDARQDEV